MVKMILEDIDKENYPPVIVFGPCETLMCKFCGKEYPSRGKHDPGYCRECEKTKGVSSDDENRSN